MPAAYTYLGQFVDHDLTFDTRSTLQTITSGLSSFPNDERTPRLDMDCLYGLRPNSAPYMYDEDGRLATNPVKPYDLPRSAILFKPDDPQAIAPSSAIQGTTKTRLSAEFNWPSSSFTTR